MDQQHQDQGQGNGSDHKPLSCSELALILKRNPVSVFRAIKRIGLEPELTTGTGYKFYPHASIKTIGDAMRAPNRPKTKEPVPA